ncbi:malonate decarboxylase holo-[acyl-carrier-protein] synthase [Legionella maceachernii]|uniref:Nucleotidyltransferase n=1 Tax=Legionella maceachernii TaxID=466 RepID=A0A0W0VX70_9GAMM|nr:malonate decarboxylase holo-[acyl-carrier-protein] synthase [Legionella maceachernii]KTD24664.1 nucleotidyltransferase [Legionella maceachernii]SKA26643.1 phosphoribosyl-dephospho-CoA transferase [Legionella maceachernii]SUP01856.1 phosphoribosyl-dephospho-CoA transferase [Legionella maceachernii]
MIYHRHTLCYLEKGAKPLSPIQKRERELLDYWLEHQFPLIYTSQPKELKPGLVQLAFPFFDLSSQEKRRFRAHFDSIMIREVRSLPTFQEVFPQVTLKLNTDIKVYGSYGWQHLTQLCYVHPNSDLDLLLLYEKHSLTELAELYWKLKQILAISRLDGEIRFPHFGDCSWLELIQPNSSATILYKSAQHIKLISRDYLYAQVPTLRA